jgi:hypothetical protein
VHEHCGAWKDSGEVYVAAVAAATAVATRLKVKGIRIENATDALNDTNIDDYS